MDQPIVFSDLDEDLDLDRDHFTPEQQRLMHELELRDYAEKNNLGSCSLEEAMAHMRWNWVENRAQRREALHQYQIAAGLRLPPEERDQTTIQEYEEEYQEELRQYAQEHNTSLEEANEAFNCREREMIANRKARRQAERARRQAEAAGLAASFVALNAAGGAEREIPPAR